MAVPDRLTRARTGWRAAEERLYPLALVDPEGYQRVIGLVGDLLEVLRRVTVRCEQLLELADRPGPLLVALPDSRPDSASEFGAATLLSAAFAIRARELSALAAGDERQRLIAAARSDGHDWVCLHGPAELSELVEGHRAELHLPSGTSLVGTVDPWSGAAPFLLEAGPAESGAERRVRRFADRVAWLREHERWRAEIEALTTEAGTVSDSR